MKFKIKKSYYRFFSVFLSVVMIVLSVPLTVTAQENESTDLPLTENASATIVFPESYLSTTTQKEQEAEAAKLALAATANNSQNAELLAATPVTTDTLPEGVYAIRNVGNPNMYLDTWGDSYMPDRYMQQFAYPTNPAQTRSPNLAKGGLFKLEQYGETNRYIIRLMTNNELTIGYSGNNVTTRNISTDQSEIAYSETFMIEEKTPGKFYIRPNANSYVIATPNSTASGGSTEESRLTRMLKSQSNDRALWEFCRYDGPVNSEIFIDSFPEEMVVSETVTVSGHFSSTLVDFNGPVNYSVSETYDMITDKATVNSTSGEITANAVGEIKLWANFGTCTTYEIIIIAENMSGTYFFKNVEYDDKFMQIDNNADTSQSGAKMEIRAFEGSTDQQWNVTHISDGYYKITSVASGLALTADTSADDAITQTSYSGTNYQKWKFLKQSDGTYRISPKSNSSFYMAAGGTELFSARNVETRTSQTDGKDEWVLYRCDSNVVNVEVVYDVGYSNRFSDVPTRIEEEITALQKKYLIDFGIWIEYTDPTAFISYGDSCSSNPLVICNHASNEQCYNSTSENNLYEYHHKNILNILERITRPDIASSLKIAYIGHNNCSAERDEEGNLEHLSNPFYGMAFTTQGLACIMNFSGNSQETKTLTHEFGHLFGVEDHYGRNGYDTEEIQAKYPNSEYNDNCIYGKNKDCVSVYQNLVICDGCKDRIRENLNRYDHN